MLNFYRRFLPHAGATHKPLHDVLSGLRVKGSDPISWTPEQCVKNVWQPLAFFSGALTWSSRNTIYGHLE
jgi:hypothetical protein